MMRTDNDNSQPRCEKCGQEVCEGPSTPDLRIQKGNVRWAIRLADAVCAEATAPEEGTANGVILMTTVLLVERLATTFQCDPMAVLHKVARCFALKRKYTEGVRNAN